MKPNACVIERNRNGNKSGVIRDETIIFYDVVQISVRIGLFSSLDTPDIQKFSFS